MPMKHPNPSAIAADMQQHINAAHNGGHALNITTQAVLSAEFAQAVAERLEAVGMESAVEDHPDSAEG